MASAPCHKASTKATGWSGVVLQCASIARFFLAFHLSKGSTSAVRRSGWAEDLLAVTTCPRSQDVTGTSGSRSHCIDKQAASQTVAFRCLPPSLTTISVVSSHIHGWMERKGAEVHRIRSNHKPSMNSQCSKWK